MRWIALSFVPLSDDTAYRNHYHFPSIRPVKPISSGTIKMMPDRATAESIKGYEYVHPDIVSLLLTEASWNSLNGEDCPFEIDPKSLVLKIKPKRAYETKNCSTSGFMPLDQLAHLAEECERSIFSRPLTSQFSGDNVVHLSSMGLICLSQLPASKWPTQNERTQRARSNHDDAPLLIATMVALNLLESSIRNVVSNNKSSKQKSKVGAPLLRDMIEALSELEPGNMHQDCAVDFKVLSAILRALLLPTRQRGINLRNLISHGFMSTIQRRWFALTLALIQTLDNCVRGHDDKDFSDAETTYKHAQVSTSLRTYEPMATQVSRGCVLISGDQTSTYVGSAFIPSSHLHISQFIFDVLAPSGISSLKANSSDIPSLNAIFLIAATSLLEHSLRLQWCRANERPDEAIARPSKYYVTLDGHGQRGKHDVMIAPYLHDGSRNLLIAEFGSVCLFLSDLFSAPSVEAPNIRSQLCHGTWDCEVISELESLANWMCNQDWDISSKSNTHLLDATFAITSALEMLTCCASGKPSLTHYQQVYSYTAMWRRHLNAITNNLSKLEQLVSNDLIRGCINSTEGQQSTTMTDDLNAFEIQLDTLQEMRQKLFPTTSTLPPATTVQDIYSDYEINVVLSECVAAQTLLAEVSVAINRYLGLMMKGLDILRLPALSTKEKRCTKTMTRICGISQIVLLFYSLCVYVSLLMVQNALALRDEDDDPEVPSTGILAKTGHVKWVERSRMVLSTFDTYLEKNQDRSIKALDQYLKGKALNKVVPICKDRSAFRHSSKLQK